MNFTDKQITKLTALLEQGKIYKAQKLILKWIRHMELLTALTEKPLPHGVTLSDYQKELVIKICEPSSTLGRR